MKSTPSSSSSEASRVRVDSGGGIATVTIDRPHRKNACTPAMWAAIRAAFDGISRSEARAVILTGAGGEFCAGADVLGGDRDSGAAEGPRRRGIDSMRDMADTVMAVHDCPRPVIAKVDGVAVGAGFGLALAADMIWCSDRARFSLIFARRGLSLDFGTSWLLPKRIGLHEAKRMAFTGEILDSSRAQALGIVNEVLPAEALDAAVDQVAARIASGPAIALSISKRQLNGAGTLSLFQALEAESLGQAFNLETRDTREAMLAFAQKRAPVFQGR